MVFVDQLQNPGRSGRLHILFYFWTLDGDELKEKAKEALEYLNKLEESLSWYIYLMVRDNKIYIISGRNIKKIISLLNELRNIAVEYSLLKDEDSTEIEEMYEDLISNILKSDTFEDLKFEDLIGEYTFDKMLKNVGLTTNRRK